jgi:hypothetical protein
MLHQQVRDAFLSQEQVNDGHADLVLVKSTPHHLPIFHDYHPFLNDQLTFDHPLYYLPWIKLHPIPYYYVQVHVYGCPLLAYDPNLMYAQADALWDGVSSHFISHYLHLSQILVIISRRILLKATYVYWFQPVLDLGGLSHYFSALLLYCSRGLALFIALRDAKHYDHSPSYFHAHLLFQPYETFLSTQSFAAIQPFALDH